VDTDPRGREEPEGEHRGEEHADRRGGEEGLRAGGFLEEARRGHRDAVQEPGKRHEERAARLIARAEGGGRV
jgi:hypothetical protein